MKPADIHRQICEVYEEHAMSDSMVRRWVRHFKEGRENVHDDRRSGRPLVVNEDFMRAVEEKIQENRRSTISSLCLHFPQILRSLLHEIVSDKLRFRKLCSRWVPKVLTDENKMNR
jgi:transposase-like protein